MHLQDHLMGGEHPVPSNTSPDSSQALATSLKLWLPTWLPASSMESHMYLSYSTPVLRKENEEVYTTTRRAYSKLG